MAPYVSEGIAEGLLGYWASTDGSPAEVTGETENLTGHRARTFAARGRGTRGRVPRLTRPPAPAAPPP
ncbi:hypothetical protein [Streptomyces atratus]|uniref:hypothetical protein n=1 Tax=Streptomyces atratus TaxID=1893 RepID=UPI0033F831EC